jgi:hypothetical protein
VRWVLFVFAVFVLAPGSAWAQTPRVESFEAFALAGPVQMWDDEGSLGTAVVGGAGFGYRLGRLGFEGVLDTRRHQPDFGNDVVLRANATRVTGRVVYYRGRRRVQPYVGGAVGYARIERFSEFPDDCRLVDHQFVCSSTRRFESSDRSRALSAISGVRVQTGRWFVRPEFEIGQSRDNLTMSGTIAVGLGW